MPDFVIRPANCVAQLRNQFVAVTTGHGRIQVDRHPVERVVLRGGQLHLARIVGGNDVVSASVDQSADAVAAAGAIDHRIAGRESVVRAEIDGILRIIHRNRRVERRARMPAQQRGVTVVVPTRRIAGIAAPRHRVDEVLDSAVLRRFRASVAAGFECVRGRVAVRISRVGAGADRPHRDRTHAAHEADARTGGDRVHVLQRQRVHVDVAPRLYFGAVADIGAGIVSEHADVDAAADAGDACTHAAREREHQGFVEGRHIDRLVAVRRFGVGIDPRAFADECGRVGMNDLDRNRAADPGVETAADRCGETEYRLRRLRLHRQTAEIRFRRGACVSQSAIEHIVAAIGAGQRVQHRVVANECARVLVHHRHRHGRPDAHRTDADARAAGHHVDIGRIVGADQDVSACAHQCAAVRGAKFLADMRVRGTVHRDHRNRAADRHQARTCHAGRDRKNVIERIRRHHHVLPRVHLGLVGDIGVRAMVDDGDVRAGRHRHRAAAAGHQGHAHVIEIVARGDPHRLLAAGTGSVAVDARAAIDERRRIGRDNVYRTADVHRDRAGTAAADGERFDVVAVDRADRHAFRFRCLRRGNALLRKRRIGQVVGAVEVQVRRQGAVHKEQRRRHVVDGKCRILVADGEIPGKGFIRRAVRLRIHHRIAADECLGFLVDNRHGSRRADTRRACAGDVARDQIELGMRFRRHDDIALGAHRRRHQRHVERSMRDRLVDQHRVGVQGHRQAVVRYAGDPVEAVVQS